MITGIASLPEVIRLRFLSLNGQRQVMINKCLHHLASKTVSDGTSKHRREMRADHRMWTTCVGGRFTPHVAPWT